MIARSAPKSFFTHYPAIRATQFNARRFSTTTDWLMIPALSLLSSENRRFPALRRGPLKPVGLHFDSVDYRAELRELFELPIPKTERHFIFGQNRSVAGMILRRVKLRHFANVCLIVVLEQLGQRITEPDYRSGSEAVAQPAGGGRASGMGRFAGSTCQITLACRPWARTQVTTERRAGESC